MSSSSFHLLEHTRGINTLRMSSSEKSYLRSIIRKYSVSKDNYVEPTCFSLSWRWQFSSTASWTDVLSLSVLIWYTFRVDLA